MAQSWTLVESLSFRVCVLEFQKAFCSHDKIIKYLTKSILFENSYLIIPFSTSK